MDVALFMKCGVGIVLVAGLVASLMRGKFGDSGMVGSRAAKPDRESLRRGWEKIQASVDHLEQFPNFLGRADLIATGKRLADECERLRLCAELPERAFADALERAEIFRAEVDSALEAELRRLAELPSRGNRSLRE